ncbi:MAG: hypothetical protein VX465_10765, partial [Pseudomonadota bacterium]|nr:hypothetical protein [Pseudomonadota bacterium]
TVRPICKKDTAGTIPGNLGSRFHKEDECGISTRMLGFSIPFNRFFFFDKECAGGMNACVQGPI